MGFLGDFIERMNQKEDRDRRERWEDRRDNGAPAKSEREESFRERRDYNEWKRGSPWSDYPDIDEGDRG